MAMAMAIAIAKQLRDVCISRGLKAGNVLTAVQSHHTYNGIVLMRTSVSGVDYGGLSLLLHCLLRETFLATCSMTLLTSNSPS